MQSRTRTYIVNIRFPLADGTTLQRGIAENAIDAKSAINKVDKWYSNTSHETINAIPTQYEQY